MRIGVGVVWFAQVLTRNKRRTDTEIMEQKPIKIRCPFCKAEPGQPCKSVEGHIMIVFHRERYKRN